MLKQYFSNQTKRTKQITSVLVVLIVAGIGTCLLYTSTATYTIWTRMEASSASANSILLNIDNTNCYNIGGDSSIPTNGTTWDWVDDYGGSTANIARCV